MSRSMVFDHDPKDHHRLSFTWRLLSCLADGRTGFAFGYRNASFITILSLLRLVASRCLNHLRYLENHHVSHPDKGDSPLQRPI
jgi:hypothetical protein